MAELGCSPRDLLRSQLRVSQHNKVQGQFCLDSSFFSFFFPFLPSLQVASFASVSGGRHPRQLLCPSFSGIVLLGPW